MKTNIPQRHDALVKGFLNDPDVAREFLETHLTAEVQSVCDFATLQIVPTSYIDEDLKMLCSDVTYRIELKDKTNFIYVYTLIEHQSTPVELMPFRILKYQVAIMQDHLNKYSDEKDGKLLLPLVAPIVFYNGVATPYPHSVDIAELFESRELFERVQLGKFKLVDLTVTDNNEILRHGGKLAVLETLAKTVHVRDIKMVMSYIISALVAGHEDNLSDFLFKTAYTYLSTNRENDELLELSDAVINKIPDYREMVMTHTETLLQKGRQEAEKEIAKNLLKSGVDIDTIKKATHLSEKELEQLKESLH